MSRQLQVGLVGGSAASLLLRGLEALTRASLTVPPPVAEDIACLCPELAECAEVAAWAAGQLHLPSLALGCLLGVFVGPLIDLLYLLRVWWGVLVRSCLRHRSPPLFRILS